MVTSARRELGVLGTLAVLGLAARLWLAWSTKQSDYDLQIFHAWGYRLATEPWHRFYAADGVADHLPGDLYLHGTLGRGHLLRGSLGSARAYHQSVKVLAALLDVVAAVLLHVLVRRRTGSPAWGPGAAALVLASPAIALVGSGWGQLDNLSVCLLLVFILLAGDRLDHPVAAGAVSAWCCLIKPQLGVVFLAYLVHLLLRGREERPGWDRVGRYLGSGVVAAQVLCLPFGMALVPGPARWDLPGRMAVAHGMYPEASVLAANVWSLALGVGRFPDTTPVLGVPARSLAPVLLGVAWLVVGGVYLARRRDAPTLWLGSTALMCFLFLQVRIHDRYFFPVGFLLVVLAAQSRGARRVWCAALAVLFQAGFYLGIDGVHAALMSLDNRGWAIMTDAVVNAVVLVGMLVVPFVPDGVQEAPADMPEGRARPASRPVVARPS